MRWIIKPRYDGKTYDLIYRAASEEGHGYIVCCSSQEARRVMEEAQKLKLNIRHPMTYDEIKQGRLIGFHVDWLMLDNVDLYLQRSFSVRISYATATQDNE